MTDNVFVDTNILVYARDKSADEKHQRAAVLISDLWKDRKGRISIQVLNEYFVTVVQKLKPGMSQKDAWADVVALNAWGPVAVDWRLLERARKVYLASKVLWWDALIIAAAQSCDCRIIYSEDLQHGAAYDGVNIVNPFIE